MATQELFVNVYVAGFYHRAGKPNHTNLHGGDLFTDRQAALDNAKPERGYVCTAPVRVEVPDGYEIFSNPANSRPVPLSMTRGPTAIYAASYLRSTE